MIVTGIVGVIGLKWGGNDFYSCTVNNPFTLVLGGISGTYLIIGISKYFSNHVFSKIGKHTLTIMGTHQLIIYAMTTFVPTFKDGNIISGICLLAVILIFEIPVVWLIEKYCPSFVGKKA